MAELYEVQDLAVSYSANDGGRYVFQHVEFCVEEAETLVVVGPSGCGKTSLLAAMAGSVKPREGSVLFLGEDVHSFDARKLDIYRNRDIGIVLQFFGLVADMTALENVMLPALIRGDQRAQAKARACELLGTFGLSGEADNRVCRLSGGQQQRVSIARALMNEPRAILADEPTANLDAAAAGKVMETFSVLCKEQGRALVVVSHDGRMVDRADSLLELA